MNFNLAKVIARQKREWDQKKTRIYVPRLKLSKAREALSNGLIKVIMGPRRAGKSVFATMLLADKRSAYFNFDEMSVLTGFDTEQLVPLLTQAYGSFDYLFFDEIQNLQGWQLYLNRLQREGYNLIVSGSNANLLSGELATHLTGRFDTIDIYPFSFSEFVTARNRENVSIDAQMLAEEYLKTGGYPEIVLGRGIDQSDYLKTLIQAVISKDIVTRHKLRKMSELTNTADWIFSNIAKELTFTRLSSKSADAGLPESAITVKRYMSYLEEAYLVKLVARYDLNHRERIKSPKKVFALDHGAASVMGFRASPDQGRLLENMVYTELIKSGIVDDIRYFRTQQSDREVDFVLRNGHETQQIVQVVWDLSDEKTRSRELKGIGGAMKSTRCKNAILITWDQEDNMVVDGVSVKAIPFHVWAQNAFPS